MCYSLNDGPTGKVKVKSSMDWSLTVENLLPQNVGSFINYLQFTATEVAQWDAPSCIRPQPATYNGVRDAGSNWLIITPTIYTVQYPPELLDRIARFKCWLQPPGPVHASLGMPGQRTACVATQVKEPVIIIIVNY